MSDDKQQQQPLAPGSTDAINNGCTCSAKSNNNGKGAGTNRDGQTLYWKSSDCPLHGLLEKK